MCDYCGCRFIPPIADLSAEHDRLMDLAYELRRLAEAGSRDRVVEILDGEFASLLRHHTDKEERGIFTQLRSTGEADTRLDALIGEHRDIEAQLARVHRGDDGWQEAVGRLASDLSGHIIDEEVDLFPYAMYELDDTQWDTVAEVHDAAGATRSDRVGS